MRFFFYSLEHLPIHVHVENGDGRAKINVKTLEIVENLGIKPKDLKKAVQIVKIYGSHAIFRGKLPKIADELNIIGSKL